MPVLTIIDVTGTQNYIFGTNKLRENIGASEIVAQATSYWLFDILKREFPNGTNLFQDKRKPSFEVIDETKKIGENGIVAEVIYAGGGNALILFDEIENAENFARSYTKDLLIKAPNLEIVLTHSDKNFDIDEFGEIEVSTEEIDEFGEAIIKTTKVPSILKIVEDTFHKLNLKKQNRTLSSSLQGLAVSAQCVSTGGAASKDPLEWAKQENNQKLYEVLLDKYKGKYVSGEAFEKIKTAKKANERLKEEIFKDVLPDSLEIPVELDHLGRTEGEASFVAVVHTDGNRMGARIKEFVKDAENNRDWINKMRGLSKSIHRINLTVLKNTLRILSDHIEKNEKGDFIFKAENCETFDLTKIRQNSGDDKTYFPLRPLIFGGDDLTFICDGRIALAFTAIYLKELLKKENGEFKYNLKDGEPLFARAGIAIVKSHYPFSRAYKLAEELAKSAKERINEIDADKKQAAAIDWHIAMSGLLGNLEEIRKREYTVSEVILNMRPLSLLTDNEWRTYEVFENIVKEFQGKNEKGEYFWKDKRNKVKGLRDILRKGGNSVKKFLNLYRLIETKPDGTIESKMPKVPVNVKAIETTGWHENRCGYFDAVEMLDLFYPMKEKSKTKSAGGKGE